MSKTIYNEGRVLGQSAYEEYVRQLKSVDPTFDVCTEREWLAASLGMGSSMVLKVPKGAGQSVGSGMYVYQVEAPVGSHIGAGSSVQASYFYGECDFDDRGWATLVTDYGSLISNTQQSNPQDTATTVNTTTVPLGDVDGELALPTTPDMSTIEYTTQHKRLNEYVKIVDGLVIQPGYWKKANVDSPYKDFTPDLSKNPVVRLTFMQPITNDFYVLLTGFTNRSILRGTSKFDFGATETENKQDGDFLGCEAYPWACKIQFVSSPAIDYLFKSSIRSGSRNVKVETYEDSPLVKITSNNLLDTSVYSRRSNTATSTDGRDNFGNPITVWEGTNDASHWYGSERDKNVVSECNDPSRTTSGQETVVTHNLKNQYSSSVDLGLKVENHYQADDRNVIKNGDHGGWYDIEIDPYQLIKDFIDEVFARFKYLDKRLEEIELEIEQEINHRVNGDKYVLSQMFQGDGSIQQIVDLLNELLQIVYDPDKELGFKITWEDVEIDDDYDESVTGTVRRPVISWDGKVPSSDDGTIPRAKLNIYSGSSYGSSATSFLRSRTDNSEDDLYAK